jgi:hypothetical protein
MRGEIFLTHFVRPTYKKPNRATLCEFAIRGAGILSKRYSEAVDLIIPVVLPPDAVESSLTVHLCMYHHVMLFLLFMLSFDLSLYFYTSCIKPTGGKHHFTRTHFIHTCTGENSQETKNW